jgi:F-type H+-transporting ATPase subunit b
MNIHRGKKRLPFFLLCVLLVALLGVLAFSALAAEGQAGKINLKNIWMNSWRVLNFLILAFFLVKLLKEPLGNFFKESARVIREKLQGTEEAYLEAEKELGEMERQLELLDEEIQKLRQAIGTQGQKERDKIIASAEQTAEHLLEKAKLEAAYSVEQARSQLRREVIDEAVKIAEDNVRKAINKKDQERLVDEYLRSLKQVVTS